ncbi:S-layer homology domain-containing protein [Lysinibacillus cavernae]|uniref:S-layer homology domain-containing protein n=1 Tax=Lysinibacillus cavernae TaxID=2666135 RepID=UPI0012D9852B|nr:S-layer homology domain-containing protein [Lysinibacillus cavernae]
MKKWAISAFILFTFTMLIPDVQAASWQQGDVIKGYYAENVYGTHSLSLEEDARVEFSLVDGVNNYRGYSSPNSYIVILFDSNDQRIGSITTHQDDGDHSKTVQFINLKKGTYHIKVSSYWVSTMGDYEVTYKTSPIEGTDVEPNNENSTANLSTIGNMYSGELYGAGISLDKDTYKVEIPKFGKVKVQLQEATGMSLGSSEFKLEAVNEKNRKIFSVRSTGKPSEIFVLLQPGIYYFKISLQNSLKPTNNYSFTTSFEPLVEKDWESGRNIDEANADLLESNKTYNGFLFGGNYSYDQSRDFYKFTLTKNATVTFIAHSKREGFGSLIFLDETGWQLRSGGYATSDTNTIIETKELSSGTYYVEYIPRYGLDGYEEYNLTMRIQRFTDVPAMHLYYEQIEALAQLGINKGYTDGTFHPNEAIKRKHVFAMLSRIDGLKLPKLRTMKNFKDVTTMHPNYPEIKTFYEAGIIDGSGLYMNPDMDLTRAQLAKILVNTFHLKMKGEGIAFSDINSTNSLYKYVQILASNGITLGYNGKFMPDDTVTRQHFSVFLQRTL